LISNARKAGRLDTSSFLRHSRPASESAKEASTAGHLLHHPLRGDLRRRQLGCYRSIRSAKQDWFTEQLGLINGIPSHDTFGAVFAAIDHDQFSACFSAWVADLSNMTEGAVIAIDGKCLRRNLDNLSFAGVMPAFMALLYNPGWYG